MASPRIKANQVLSNSVSTMDIMPTSIGIIDRVMNGYSFDDEAKLYNKEELDGKDISPIIFGSANKNMYDERLLDITVVKKLVR